jgi:hypothetical protein
MLLQKSLPQGIVSDFTQKNGQKIKKIEMAVKNKISLYSRIFGTNIY